MYAVLLCGCICMILFQKWKTNKLFQSKNNVSENIFDSLHIHSRFFIIPHELEPHEVVHILTL